MVINTMKYVQRDQNNRYRYRRGIPQRLRILFNGNREFVKVLGKTEEEALKNFPAIHSHFDKQLKSAAALIPKTSKSTTPSPDQIAEAIEKLGFRAEAPETDEEYQSRDALADALDYDFLPKIPNIPDHLPIRLQSFILDKFKKTIAGRTYMFRDDPCMIYLGAVDEDGYARIRVPKCATVAKPSEILSRFMYQHLVEEIGPELEVHHCCGQPSCINTRHLTAISHDLNIAIGDPRYSDVSLPCLA